MTVTFCTPKAALLLNTKLKALEIKAFIPQRLLTHKGIIRHVGKDITTENIILEEIASLALNKVPILDAQRLNRRVKEGNEIKVIPTSSFQVTFRGRTLPPRSLCIEMKRE